MNPFIFLYTEILWRPLFNGLVILYTILPGHDLGLAIVCLTLIIRMLVAPILWRSQAAQKKMAALQPELKRIQERHKNDKEAQGKAVMEFYAAHRINPFAGCVLLLVQLPILIALFGVFRKGLDPASLAFLYSFVPHPGMMSSHGLFGLIDLAKGNVILGVIAAATQYFQTRLMAPPPQTGAAGGGDFTKMLQWQTTYFFPLIILFWSYSLPSALTLYWTTMNVFGIVEAIIIRTYGDPNRHTPSVASFRSGTGPGDDQKRDSGHA